MREGLFTVNLDRAEMVRIFSQIEVLSNGCWQWTGRTSINGYGRVRLRGEEVSVHRLTYAWAVAPLPRGSAEGCLDHLCRNRLCCNPVHLEFVTLLENLARGNTNMSPNKTHCLKGHPYSGDNLYVKPSTGHRVCRTCAVESVRLHRERVSLASASE